MSGERLAARARRLAETRLMVDQGQRIIYATTLDAKLNPAPLPPVDGNTMKCRFSWGTDNDRTEQRDGRVISNPWVQVPVSEPFTSADRFRLTHQFGQPLNPPLIFKMAGEPLIEVGYQTLELKRVTT